MLTKYLYLRRNLLLHFLFSYRPSFTHGRTSFLLIKFNSLFPSMSCSHFIRGPNSTGTNSFIMSKGSLTHVLGPLPWLSWITDAFWTWTRGRSLLSQSGIRPRLVWATGLTLYSSYVCRPGSIWNRVRTFNGKTCSVYGTLRSVPTF